MTLDGSFVAHIVLGTLAAVLYWAALGSRKGSPRHKAIGRTFLCLLVGVLVSVALLLFAGDRRFAVPVFVQFGYLCLCVATVGTTGYLAIRRRGALETFRGPLFRALGVAAFAGGALLLSIGLIGRLPMPIVFSVIGLLFGGAMIRFAWFTPTPHRNWSLIWHLNAMCFLFNAVHGTALAVIWKMLLAPNAGHEVNVVTQLGTMAVALGLRMYFGARFDAPLRLRSPSGDAAPAGIAVAKAALAIRD